MSLHTVSVISLWSSVVVLQLAKLFADLSTMADLTLPTTPQVSTCTNISFSQKITITQLKMLQLKPKRWVALHYYIGVRPAHLIQQTVYKIYSIGNKICCCLLQTQQKKKRASDKTTPRKRKLEQDTRAERRNPSRKARPPENFAVEEKSEPVTHRGPRTVDLRRLVKVKYTQRHTQESARYVLLGVNLITFSKRLHVLWGGGNRHSLDTV